MLDDSARRTGVTLVSAGFSRRAAAHWVGCSPATVTRTAQRDPAFAERLAQASRFMQLEALQGIRKAIGNPRYWRAAAWFLERTNPGDYGPRPMDHYAEKATLHMFQQFIPMFLGEVPRENLRRVLNKLEEMMREQEFYVPPTDPPDLRDSVDDLLDDSFDDEPAEPEPSAESDNDPESDNAAAPKTSDEPHSPVVNAPPSADSGQPSPTPSSFCNNPPVGCGDVPPDVAFPTYAEGVSYDPDAHRNPCNANQDALHKPPDSS